MNTSETLNAAADFIQARGWDTGADAWGEGEGLCIEGALMAALGLTLRRVGELWKAPAYVAVADYLELGLTGGPALEAKGHRGVCLWNDAKGRTAAEVVETLRACALITATRESVTA